MGDPYVGYVRDPASVTDAGDIQKAIASASERFGVPLAILERVHRVEGPDENAYQEVGYNSAGHGGFFGLDRSLLGSAQQQADTAAQALAQAFGRTGNWEDALSIYRTGQPGQGYPGGSGVAAAPAAVPAFSPAIYLVLVAAVVFFVVVVI